MDHSLPCFIVPEPFNESLQEAYAWMKWLMVATSGVMEQIIWGGHCVYFSHDIHWGGYCLGVPCEGGLNSLTLLLSRISISTYLNHLGNL
jgi:hypothetical protein